MAMLIFLGSEPPQHGTSLSSDLAALGDKATG